MELGKNKTYDEFYFQPLSLLQLNDIRDASAKAFRDIAW